MKAALVDPSLFTWPYERDLMDGLRTAGVEVRLFGSAAGVGTDLGERAGIVGHFYPVLARPPLSNLSAGLRRAAKGLFHAPGLARLSRDLAAWRPDAIHFQWVPLPALDRLFLPALRRVAPLVLTVHDSMPFNGNPGARLQRWGARAVLRDFDALVVHTAQARRRLVEEGVPAERVTIVPHGLLSDGGDAMTDLPPAEAAAEVTFLMFGKIKPYKGVDTLIAALARVPRDLDQAWRVQVVGQPYMDMAPLRDAAAGLGLAARVEFDLRPVPEAELATLFGRATAVVMPYREIDASGVLAMAIRAGRIVIASRIGNFAELLDDGRTALLVPPDDPAALGDAMARVLTEPALRARLAAGVRDLRDRMPTWFSIGAETAAIYRRLATARAVALETRGRAAASTR